MAVATRLWELERRAQLAELGRRGLTVVDWDPATPLDAALARIHRPRLRAVLAG
jgi:hypothetical protein